MITAGSNYTEQLDVLVLCVGMLGELCAAAAETSVMCAGMLVLSLSLLASLGLGRTSIAG